MDKKIIIGAIVLLILAGALGFSLYQKNGTEGESRVSEGNPSLESEQTSYKEQVNEGGGVTVTVKPLILTDSGTWDFELTLQTHTVALDMDILKSVVLIDADGQEIPALVWNGDVPGGHHRTGTILFEPLNPVPDSLVLQVKDVAGVDVLTFTWKLSE